MLIFSALCSCLHTLPAPGLFRALPRRLGRPFTLIGPAVKPNNNILDPIPAPSDSPQPALRCRMAAVERCAAEQGADNAPQHGQRIGGPDTDVAATAATAAATASTPLVRDCWEQALDLNSGQYYWFNRATGVSQWHAPPGWALPAAGGHTGASSAPAQQAAEAQPAAPAQEQGEQQWHQHPLHVPETAQHDADSLQPPQHQDAAAGEAGAAQPPCAQAQQQEEQQQQLLHYEPGLYYRDACGQLQGPFSLEQLREWRGLLPMDLVVLRLALCEDNRGGHSQPAVAGSPGDARLPPSDATPPAADVDQGACTAADADAAGGSKASEPVADVNHGASSSAANANAGAADGIGANMEAAVEEQQLQAAHQPDQQRGGGDVVGDSNSSSSSGKWEQLELAGLLGDEELLERWRLENPEQAAWPGAAPPAPAYEADLARGSGHSLAAAVLSGLPAHDEEVVLARLAAAAGKSVQEVAAWTRSVDAVSAYRVAARGRIQAASAQESLYAENASWADPWTLEQQLARTAEKRKRGLSGEELKVVKQRKQELKEKKRQEWLLS